MIFSLFLMLIVVIFIVPFIGVQPNEFMIKTGIFFQLLGFVFIIFTLDRIQKVFMTIFSKINKNAPTHDTVLAHGIVYNIAGLTIQLWHT